MLYSYIKVKIFCFLKTYFYTLIVTSAPGFPPFLPLFLGCEVFISTLFIVLLGFPKSILETGRAVSGLSGCAGEHTTLSDMRHDRERVLESSSDILETI